ncbi:MAG: molecular chaperone [Proteobacteria bacterium]|nr:molecular chaperone [Pseudomonadota bacterium]
MLLRLLIFALAPVVLFATACTGVMAMSVSPIEVEMSSVGMKSRAQITVINDSADPLPVEAVLQSLSLNERGEKKLANAGDDFLVFPTQAMIAPGGMQVFRMQWVGDPEILASKTFLMSLNQVPVRMKGRRSEVQVVIGLGVVINVAPPTGLPKIRLLQTSIVQDPVSGKRRPIISVENVSNVHALLSQSTISVSGDGWSVTIPSGLLKTKLGFGLVQPGRRRTFILPVDLPSGVRNVVANIDFRPKR